MNPTFDPTTFDSTIDLTIDSGDGKLAVVTKVDKKDDYNHDDEKFLPAAIEYNPDGEPFMMYRNRRFRLYGFIFVFVMVGCVFAATKIEPEMETREATIPLSTSWRESLGIQDKVREVIENDEALYDPNTPEARALEWILKDDPMRLLPDSYNVIQRYLMAYFYFHTSAKSPWLTCAPPSVGRQQRDSCKHMNYYSAEDTYIESNASRWLSRKHECHWAGVKCQDMKWVESIELDGYHLSGNFPIEITKMPFLSWIILSNNKFTGTLPSQIAVMPFLQRFDVHGNFFTGTVPKEWIHLEVMNYLEIGNNQLTGTIPSEIAQISPMKWLYMYDNAFTGSIPTELFTMSNLLEIALERNDLAGTIPTEIGLASKLYIFRLGHNKLTGTLPTELGLLTNMGTFQADSLQLTGNIPDEIFVCDVYELYLDNNHLSGTISTNIGQLTNLRYLTLSDNILSGSIPTEFGKLSRLQEATFQFNNFVGMIPNELCALRGPTQLKKLEVDCTPTGVEYLPPIDCTIGCYTLFCEKETHFCSEVNVRM